MSINTGMSGGPEDGDFTLSGAVLGTGSTTATITIPQGSDTGLITLTSITGDGDVDNEIVIFTLTDISNSSLFEIATTDTADILIIDNGVNP